MLANYLNRFYFILCLFCFLWANISCDSENDEILPDFEYIYEVHFIDVGQGDAIFIATPEKTVLVDAGSNNCKAADYLAGLDIENIDIAIATHPHADHIGGFIEIFETYEIGEVIDPGVSHTTLTYHQYKTAIDENNISYTVGTKGMTRDIGDNAYLTILHPPDPVPDYSVSYLNNASIVASVNLKEVKVLLTGDVEGEGESDLLENPGKLQSHILKVAHHGSNSSSTMEFLQAAQPALSIIMCGTNNKYGHPHQPVLDRLNDIESEVFRTDIHGNIIIRTDGVNYNVYVNDRIKLIL